MCFSRLTLNLHLICHNYSHGHFSVSLRAVIFWNLPHSCNSLPALSTFWTRLYGTDKLQYLPQIPSVLPHSHPVQHSPRCSSHLSLSAFPRVSKLREGLFFHWSAGLPLQTPRVYVCVFWSSLMVQSETPREDKIMIMNGKLTSY